MHNLTRDSQTTPIKIYSDRRQSQLSRQSRNSHSGHACCQITIQQHSIDKRSTIHDNRHIKFLPHDSAQTTQIHTNQMSDIPEEIQIKYNLHELATPDESLYVQANKGM